MACLAAALTPLCRFVNLETVQRDGRDFNTAFADLVHLRTALWFHAVEPINRFLTRDESQRQAAKALGLPI